MQGGWVIPKPLKWNDIIDKPPVLEDSIVEWSEVENKPTTFPPEIHVHDWESIIEKPSGVDALVSEAKVEQITSEMIADTDLNSLWDVNVNFSQTGQFLKLVDSGNSTSPKEWGARFIDWIDIQNKPTNEQLKGDKGDIGPMPSHQWLGTTLRFQISSTTWGNYVELKGTTGATGAQGIQGIQGATGAIGPAGTTTWGGITDKPTTFAPAAHNHNSIENGSALTNPTGSPPPYLYSDWWWDESRGKRRNVVFQVLL